MIKQWSEAWIGYTRTLVSPISPCLRRNLVLITQISIAICIVSAHNEILIFFCSYLVWMKRKDSLYKPRPPTHDRQRTPYALAWQSSGPWKPPKNIWRWWLSTRQIRFNQAGCMKIKNITLPADRKDLQLLIIFTKISHPNTKHFYLLFEYTNVVEMTLYAGSYKECIQKMI